MLNPIMFGDDTNLFFAHLDIRYLFQTVNQVNQSMVYSKYAFTKYKKTNYLFFHKPGQKKTIHFFSQNL